MVTATTAGRILRATVPDAEYLGWLIAEAFTTADSGRPMPATEWLVPDPDHRARVLAGQFTILTDWAIRWGQVDTTPQRDAVAVWMPIGASKPAPPGPEDYQRRLDQACSPYTERLLHLDALFAAHKPAGPFHHLMFLAVHPEQQNTGIGSMLLHRHLTELDRHRIPAYLEASSPRNRDLYQRHGFTDHGKPFGLNRQATFWPMLREPHPLA
jgi:ribosomal protein S18 acetylase RimI-like enzyme